MNAIRAAGAPLIAGSLTFLNCAQLGVPGVFTEPSPHSRLGMLEENIGRWCAAQPLYGLGPIITALGATLLAADAPVGARTRAIFWLAAAALLAGSLARAWYVYLCAIRVADFAFARLPGWPFAT